MTAPQPPSPERLALARELVLLQQELMAPYPTPPFRMPRSVDDAGPPGVAEQAEAVAESSRRFMERHHPPERQVEIRARVFAEHLDEAELREALAFLRGRPGRKYVEATARAGAALIAAFQAAMEEHGGEFRESIDERMRRWERAEGLALPEDWESDGDDWKDGSSRLPPRG